MTADDLKELTEAMQLFAFDILGLQNERGANNDARAALPHDRSLRRR